MFQFSVIPLFSNADGNAIPGVVDSDGSLVATYRPFGVETAFTSILFDQTPATSPPSITIASISGMRPVITMAYAGFRQAETANSGLVRVILSDSNDGELWGGELASLDSNSRKDAYVKLSDNYIYGSVGGEIELQMTANATDTNWTSLGIGGYHVDF